MPGLDFILKFLMPTIIKFYGDLTRNSEQKLWPQTFWQLFRFSKEHVDSAPAALPPCNMFQGTTHNIRALRNIILKVRIAAAL